MLLTRLFYLFYVDQFTFFLVYISLFIVNVCLIVKSLSCWSSEKRKEKKLVGSRVDLELTLEPVDNVGSKFQGMEGRLQVPKTREHVLMGRFQVPSELEPNLELLTPT